jgi:serine/threonine-protein kinase
MGAVYRAWDSSLQRAVALKVLLHDTPQTRQRFMREARAQARIKHPNVVPIHYVGDDGGVAFLVMDLVEGESLAALLHRDGPLPPARALEVADAIAAALEAGAEHGLVHRDVKPANVLVERHGHVLLADFGLAKWQDAPAAEEPVVAPAAEVPPDPSHSGVVTRAGALVGTPAYAAPEQTTSGGNVDARTDIYALGVTLYEVLTGQPPFSAPTVTGLVAQHHEETPLSPRTLVPTLPAAADALVLRMMAKRPQDRYASPTVLRQAIAAARERPKTDASPFTRALALAIDVPAFGIGGLVAGLLWNPLIVPVGVLLMGLIDGRFGTTPGKKLLQLRTLDGRGDPPGLKLGLLRTIVKSWGPLVLAASGDAFGDSGPLGVVQGILFVGWLATSAAVFFGQRRALHDRLAGTRVVYDL